MAFLLANLSGPHYAGAAQGAQLWLYATDDASAVIIAAGYMVDVGAGAPGPSNPGVKVGDFVNIVRVTTLPNITPLGRTDYVVSAIDADGDGTLISTAIA